MNGPERPIMTGTTNGGGIGSEGRAWLNDVTALVSATAANNNNNPGSNPHHSASLNSPRLHEPPPLLRAAASSSLFRPPISLSSAQDYSPSSSAHLYQQFPALHGTPSYYPPPPTASHGQTLPPPAINPYSYYPLQFSPRGYPSPPTASIIPRPFPQLESYHSSVLAGMGSHPRSAFLPSQYSSSLNPSSSSPNETASFALIPPRTHTTYGQVQYPSAESESHSPSKEGGRHKTSSSTSSLSVASRLGSRSETMSSGKNCSPGLVVVDKRDLSPHFRESLSSLSREQMQQMSYRVPSGKEGSLKHRILTRPPDIHIEHSALSAEKSPDMCKDSSPKQLKLPAASPATTSLSMPCTPLRTTAWRSPPPPPMSAGATPLRYPAHFVKGSIIQLANGELKSVEELRTEDFVQSADMSSDLKIDSSTVVRIEENAAANTSILGFSVGEQRVQVTVEAALEHPFFVFGQGWSSCLPDRTQQRYNLQCKKLQVGDVCISLTHRDQQQQQQQQQQSTRSVASLIRPPTDACARLMVPTKANDNCTSGVVTTHSIETQTQTLSSGGAAQITSCRPNAACFFPPPASVSGSQPASLPRKRRWSAPDKVAEEFIPRTKFS
uniref:AXH domain-containing protein n=1 Tax=Strigamia maritima TaxID=126957 RepID=T1J561_STRMM